MCEALISCGARVCRSLVILSRKFIVVIIGGLVYGEPRFAAVFTAISLFIAFVLHKAYRCGGCLRISLHLVGSFGRLFVCLFGFIASQHTIARFLYFFI